jgi:hypothetical protein
MSAKDIAPAMTPEQAIQCRCVDGRFTAKPSRLTPEQIPRVSEIGRVSTSLTGACQLTLKAFTQYVYRGQVPESVEQVLRVCQALQENRQQKSMSAKLPPTRSQRQKL